VPAWELALPSLSWALQVPARAWARSIAVFPALLAAVLAPPNAGARVKSGQALGQPPGWLVPALAPSTAAAQAQVKWAKSRPGRARDWHCGWDRGWERGRGHRLRQDRH